MTKMMFDSFNVQSLYNANESTLSIYSSGEIKTGCMLDSEDTVSYSYIVPVYEGHLVSRTIKPVWMLVGEI